MSYEGPVERGPGWLTFVSVGTREMAGHAVRRWGLLLLAIIACRGPADPARAVAQCVDYGAYLHWSSSDEVLEPLGQVAFADGIIYAAGTSERLHAFDATHTDDLRLLGSVTAPYWVSDIAVHGDLACVTDRYAGLYVFDVSAPASLVVLGNVEIAGEAVGVAMARDTAFVAAGWGGLQVVDLTDPLAPAIVGQVALPDTAHAVALNDSCAFVADNLAGLVIVDIRDRLSPQVIGAVSMPGAAHAVSVSGSFAYVATRTYGHLQVVDISDPRAPRIVATSDESWWAMTVCAEGTRVLVLDLGRGGVHLYDVGDPLAPRVVASSLAPGFPADAVLGGSAAIVAGAWGGLHALDTAEVQTVPPLGTIGAQPAGGVAIDDGLACVACGLNGTRVVDLSDPVDPRLLGSVAPRSTAADVEICGALAFVADGAAGLQIIDLSDSAHPVSIGATYTHDYARRLAVDGDYAYIADVDSGLQIIDIADPRNPVIVGSVETPGRAMGVGVAGDVVCIADFHNGLQVIDVSDRRAPRLVGSVQTLGIANDVMIVGTHAYLANDHRGLQIIDISDPAAPRLSGRAETLHYANSVDVHGTTAYVADGLAGLSVVDVTDPERPRLVGSVAVPGGFAYGVAADASLVCLAANNGATVVFPAHCAASTPVLLTTFDLVPGAGAVTITWELGAGSEEAHYRLLASTSSREWEVAVELNAVDRRHSITDRSPWLTAGTFVTYRLLMSQDSRTWRPLGTASTSIPAGAFVTGIRSAYPNPLNPNVTIGFTCRRAGHAQLAIHDVAGRRVALLVAGPLEGGEHEAVWDGRDQSGRLVPTGQYVARLVTDDGESARKVLLVK